MDIFFIIFYGLIFLLLSHWIGKKFMPELHRYTLPVAFIGKLAFAGIYWYIYSYYYGDGELVEDAGEYLKDARILYDVFHQSPSDFFRLFFDYKTDFEFVNGYLHETTKWMGGQAFLIHDTRNIVRVNTLFYFISYGVGFVHFIFLTFASFFAGIELYQWLKKSSKLQPVLLLGILILFPSIAFWSSNVLKEPLLILGIAFLIRGTFDSLSLYSKLWRIGLGCILILGFKSFVFVLFIPALAYYYFSFLFKNIWLSIGVFLGISLLFFGLFSKPITETISNKQADFINVRNGGLYVHADEEHYYYFPLELLENVSINEEENTAELLTPSTAFILEKSERLKRDSIYLEEVGQEFPIYINLEGAKSKVNVTVIDNNPMQLFLNIPEAMFNTFLEPLPRRGSGILQLEAFLENILFLLLIGAMIFFHRPLNLQEKRVVITLTLFIISTALIVGWTTTVSGAIVRYMIPAHIGILVLFGFIFKRKETKKDLKVE